MSNFKEVTRSVTEEDLGVLWRVCTYAAVMMLMLVALVLCIKAYIRISKGVCKSTQTLNGKTVIVTGANAGIGKETAKELARRKARVILACRNLEKGKEAAQEILEETQQPVVVKHLDLASLKSVRHFAEDILKTESRLDVLINNAGMSTYNTEVELTEDGYEVCFQANYIGHVLLTLLLAGLLKKSAPSRVVNLSSILHHLGNADNLRAKATGTERPSHPVLIYCHTKMALLAFTRVLAEKLKPHGVTVNALHPGSVKTNIVAKDATGLVAAFVTFVFDYFGKTPKEGAQTSVYAAVDPSLANTTGRYFVDCSEGWMNWKALDKDKNSVAFETSLELVGLSEKEVDKILEQ